MTDQLDIFGFDADQLEEVKIDNPTTLSQVFNNIAVTWFIVYSNLFKKRG